MSTFKEIYYQESQDKIPTVELAFAKNKLNKATYSPSSGIDCSYCKVPSVPLVEDYSLTLNLLWGEDVEFRIQIWTKDRLMPFIAANTNVMKGFEEIFIKSGIKGVQVKNSSDGAIHIRGRLDKKVEQYKPSPVFNKLVSNLSTKNIEKIFKDAFGKDMQTTDLVSSILKGTRLKAEHSTKNANSQSPIGQWEFTSKNASSDYNKLVAYMDSKFESNSRQGSDTNRTKTYMVGYNRYIAIKQENDLVIVKPYRG